MVECDGALVASTIASFMMDGMCCAWRRHEEDDRRVATMNQIRTPEYERKREIDKAIRERRSKLEHSPNISDASLQEERRRRLIAEKMKISLTSSRMHFVRDEDRHSVTMNIPATENDKTSQLLIPNSLSASTCTAATQPFKKRRSKIQRQCSAPHVSSLQHSFSDRSLLDEEEDVDDEKSSLVEIALR